MTPQRLSNIQGALANVRARVTPERLAQSELFGLAEELAKALVEERARLDWLEAKFRAASETSEDAWADACEWMARAAYEEQPWRAAIDAAREREKGAKP